MTTRRHWTLVVGLAAALAVGLALADRAMPARAEAPKRKEKAALGKGKRAQEFIAAFNRGDAEAVAGFWAPDADYVDQVGHHFKGREEIEKLYRKVFAENKGAKLTIHVKAARMVTPDVAIEDGLTEVTPADGGPPSVAQFSAVLVKKDGEWYFTSVRDSIAHPPSNAEHFGNLELLIGDWEGEAKKGESARASYHWAENQNFIVSSFATTLNGVPVVGGTQWIGWDAVEKQVRSWSFYSGGGFGDAVWSRDGDNKWTFKTTAQSSAGKKMTATNALTITDPDHMTWQLTNLTVDGKQLPDGPPMKLKRVKAERP